MEANECPGFSMENTRQGDIETRVYFQFPDLEVTKIPARPDHRKFRKSDKQTALARSCNAITSCHKEYIFNVTVSSVYNSNLMPSIST